METNRMKIYSAPLISELKTFVALGTGYEAKIGETDDLVMATLLAIRMMRQLQTYHSDMDRNMRDFDREIVQPMPFFASSSPISIY